MNNCLLIEKGELLFDLEDYFCKSFIDLENKEYFPVNRTPSRKAYFVQAPNIYIDNEMRGYIRYLVVNKKLAPITIYNIINHFTGTLYKFLSERYVEKKSILEFELEIIEKEYRIWLNERGINTSYEDERINSKMEIKKRTYRFLYLTRLEEYYNYIYDLLNVTVYTQKDRWYLDQLGIPYNVNPAVRRKSISFHNIYPVWLKNRAKKIIYNQIPLKSIGYLNQLLKTFRILSTFLEKKKSRLESLKDFSKDDADEFLAYCVDEGFSSYKINEVMSSIRCIFNWGMFLEINEYPFFNPFDDMPNMKRPKRFIEGFSYNEISNINNYIDRLPKQLARITLILESCGMRVSDLLCATIKINEVDALRLIDNKGYLFSYIQPKTNKLNTIPVEDVVASNLMSAIEESRSLFGDDVKYIFAISVDKCLSSAYYLDQMNKLSYECQIKNDDGGILRIKGHSFRRYVATDLINNGATPDIIKFFLGHYSNGAYGNYAKIHSETMHRLMSGIIAQKDYMIRNIGKLDTVVIDEVDKGIAMPLLGGYCAKPMLQEECGDAFKCYTCKMFRADKNYLSFYKNQLTKVEIAMRTAEINGYQRLLEKTTLLKEAIERIIVQLERE